MGVGTLRRYRALKARAAQERNEEGIAGAFKTKQEETPGTPLPEDFPGYDDLTVAEPTAYTTYEDLDGATVDELVAINGIGKATANKILAAVESWKAAQ